MRCSGWLACCQLRGTVVAANLRPDDAPSTAATSPHIRDCGLPGRRDRAFVVPAAPIIADELIAWSKTRMAGFKAPCYVEFLDALLLNATGKVMKDQLR
jgi:acyl-CoA synthetase (AMP-forming)/AMP-acid ligase II